MWKGLHWCPVFVVALQGQKPAIRYDSGIARVYQWNLLNLFKQYQRGFGDGGNGEKF